MRPLILLLVFLFSAGTAIAQADISPISLVGKWTTESKHPSGATITSTVVLTQNLRFSASSMVDGKPFVQFAGTWSVAGNLLTWRYETSSAMTPAPGTTDMDEIVSVDASRLILRSKLSGKQHEYVRFR
jgi:hypothetical protein